MISATDAQNLYTQPSYSEEEVEQRIKTKAERGDYACFDKARLTGEVKASLEANGFKVELAVDDYIVSWGESK